jgi:hypothetical protein
VEIEYFIKILRIPLSFYLHKIMCINAHIYVHNAGEAWYTWLSP